MTLTTIIIYTAIFAVIWTALVKFVFKREANLILSLLQSFCGGFFIFSGFVKAVDPLGTAYKMEQYFSEFETHFSLFTPIFQFLSGFTVSFSVIMIVLEIVLGVMLLIGAYKKLTSWLFFAIVAFFTVLTGFTYLTGYVPGEATFLQFSQWGPYEESNMKVTDCGCFGDFIKLKPKVTFMKDVALMFPAILFLFWGKNFHQLFTDNIRKIITFACLGLVTFYCISNYVWDIPGNDFRPFKVGVNIPETKLAEEEAASSAPVFYNLTNKASSEVTRLDMDTYITNYKSYPKEEWEIEQERGEPTIPSTKISEFEVSNANGDDVTDDILSDPNYSFMIVSYKLYGDSEPTTVSYQDTTYAMDTIITEGVVTINKNPVKIEKKTKKGYKYSWEGDYLDKYKSVVNPIAAAAKGDKINTYVITSYSDLERLNDFSKSAESSYQYYQADDILLKTIVRSNPGIVLMKNGKIINKWHYKQVPDYAEIKSTYMK